MNVKETRDKVVNHVKENKNAYIVAGVTAVVSVGATAGVMHMRSAQNASVRQGIAYKSPVTQHVIQQSIPRAGHAGKVFVDRADPAIKPYMSVRELADARGVSRNTVQNYLAGKIPDLAGRQYDMIADGAPNLMAEMKIEA